MNLDYQDTATFYKVSSSGYANNKVIEEEEDVSVIFLQGTGFSRVNFQESITSDAICYPDPDNEFIVENHNRLEGMYILAPLFDASEDEGWYKVIDVTVNRDHLLGNLIDNILLTLKKTKKIYGIS